ncbi:adrenocortical dysplasia protein homolog [Tenrec ecaudatus]|uniref:adrenocortical dysplasia protein homolog n=1 Tax=Tenrec ecaudatus TaxID=94439 RepID=UPI003F5AA61C
MAAVGNLVLRPWIRELVLGSETLSSPRAGQLLEVLQEDDEAPGPSRAPDASYVGAALLVSDGTHSIRCQLTREALNTSAWEKEFGFRGTEGRLLLLQDCGVCVQVTEHGMPAEFYLQVDRFSLLPNEQPRTQVASCNQDRDVQKKLYDCLEKHLSEATSPDPGLTLSQLLDEVQEDQEQRGALVRLAESCLMLAGPQKAPHLTRWAASSCRAMGEDVYTVPSLWLCIPDKDQQILSSLCLGRDLPPPDPALHDLSLPLPSPSCASGTPPGLPDHSQSEENSISLLPAEPLASSEPVQRDSTQTWPASHSTPASHPRGEPSSPLLSCALTVRPCGQGRNPHQARGTRAQKYPLEFKELGVLPQKPRTSSTKEALNPSAMGDPPERHRDGSTFQYKYAPPCTALCAQVQAVRLPPELLAWALHLLMEPPQELEVTQG